MMTLFSEKVISSDRCISCLMSNLIKKSWTVSTNGATRKKNPQHHNKFMSGNFCTLNFKISTLCWYHMKRLTVQFRWHCNAMHYQNLQCLSDYCGNISRQVQCILDLVTLLEFVRKWLFSEDREEKGNDVTSTTFQLLIILIWRACRWNSETISSLDLRW